MYPYYYRLLEMEPGATQEELRRAYRRLVKVWHPDVNRSPGAKERFLQIQKAWQVLGDPKSRARYEHQGKYYGSRTADPAYRRTPPPPPHVYQQRRTRAYTGYGGRMFYRTVDQETLQKEEKIRKRDMLVGVIVALLIFGISSSGKVLPRIRLHLFGQESVGEVYNTHHSVNYFFSTADDQIYGEIYPNLMDVEGEAVLPGKMPLESGDKFKLRYLESHPETHKIDFKHPDESTLGKYFNKIYLRWMLTPLLDTLAHQSMKTVFLYTLCDSVYHYYGINGLADLYYAQTPAIINPDNNTTTFKKLLKRKRFRKFLASIRESTLPL